MTQEGFRLLADALGVIATAVMLFLTGGKPMSQTTEQTDEQRVHAMLDDAVQNQYDIRSWSVDDIICDLLAFAELKEGEDEAMLRPHVITWKQKRTTPT